MDERLFVGLMDDFERAVADLVLHKTLDDGKRAKEAREKARNALVMGFLDGI